eukprot:805676-Prorocentrum_lima.AAC.1
MADFVSTAVVESVPKGGESGESGEGGKGEAKASKAEEEHALEDQPLDPQLQEEMRRSGLEQVA